MKNEHKIEGEIQNGSFLPYCCLKCGELLFFPVEGAYCKEGSYLPTFSGVCKVIIKEG